MSYNPNVLESLVPEVDRKRLYKNSMPMIIRDITIANSIVICPIAGSNKGKVDYGILFKKQIRQLLYVEVKEILWLSAHCSTFNIIKEKII